MASDYRLKTMPAVAIIGGGIAGLAAAWELEQAGCRDWILCEASARLGGVIESRHQNAFVMEGGADSFLSSRPAWRELCRDAGLEDELIGTATPSAGAQVFHRGRLQPLPAGWRLLEPTQLRPLLRSPLLSTSEKAAIALRWRTARGDSRGEESVAGYLRRRFGPRAGRALAAKIAGPLLGGVYGGDAERLSAEPFLRSAPAAPPQASMFTSLRGGMGSLVEALAARLGPERLRTGIAVTSARAAGSGWRIESANAPSLAAPGLILAISAFAAAAVLQAFDASLAHELNAIPYASSVNVNLAYRHAPALPAGHGFLAAAGARPLLACTFAHQKFAGRAPAGGALLRWFFSDAAADWSDAETVAAARKAALEMLGIAVPPDFAWARRCARAMPQYVVGHRARVAAIQVAVARHSGLALAGNAYAGVGVPDCIASGRAAARTALAAAASP